MAYWQWVLVGVLVLQLAACSRTVEENKGRHILSPSQFLNKAQGMLYMAAFGDALGARNELIGLTDEIAPADQWLCTLSDANTFYNETSEQENCWGVWPPVALVNGSKGIVTDDTSYKIALLEPYLQTSLQHDIAINEVTFKEYMVVYNNYYYSRARNVSYPSDWYYAMAREMAADWVVMMDVADVGHVPSHPRRHGGNIFYFPNNSVCMGWYLYMELSASFFAVSPFDTYTHFRQICSMDEEYGHEVTGLVAALQSQAVVNQDENAVFSLWMDSKIQLWIPDWISRVSNVTEQQNLKTIGDYLRYAYHLGVKLRNVSTEEWLQQYSAFVNNATISPSNSMKLQNPLTMLGGIVCASATAQNDINYAFLLMSSGPGDSDTIASYYGQLVGAFYGLMRVSEFKCSTNVQQPVALGVQLATVADSLHRFFGYNATAAAHALLQYSNKLPV